MAPQPPTSLLVEAYRGCEGLPLVGGLFTRGRVEAKAVLSVIVAAVLDELDLTEIIRDKLQTEAVDAVIARIDLIALADQVIDGVRYVNNAFGYPGETRIAAKRLLCLHET